jgi:hypothetical protein
MTVSQPTPDRTGEPPQRPAGRARRPAGPPLDGPFGEHRPSSDVGVLLTPRTATVTAASLALGPHQPGRLGPDRKNTDVGDVTAARHGPLPAHPAGVEVADGLDQHVPLVDELEHAQHPQPGDPEQRHRRRRRSRGRGLTHAWTSVLGRLVALKSREATRTSSASIPPPLVNTPRLFREGPPNPARLWPSSIPSMAPDIVFAWQRLEQRNSGFRLTQYGKDRAWNTIDYRRIEIPRWRPV